MSAEEVWANIANKYAIHKETSAGIETAQQIGFKPIEQCTTLEEARENLEKVLTTNEDNIPFEGSVKEMIVPSDQVANGIPITVYKSSNAPKDPAIVIALHGGGLVSCSRKTFNGCVQMMSKNSGAVIISVEYRLLPCPEDNFAPFNDAVAVTRWVLDNKETVGGCAGSKVGVAGDNGGGQIACCVGNEIKQLDFQILIYPVTDILCNGPSFEEFRAMPFFNTEGLKLMIKNYGCPTSEIVDNPRFHPLVRKDLKLSPPTLMIHAQLDPLIDSNKSYAEKLKAAGVEVEEMLTEGVPHGFFTMVQHFPTACVPAHTRVAEFIKRFQ